MNDDQYFLANAYLDGELDADELAIAVADPEVMSEVERLRALQSEIRTVDAPTPAARESAIAAAMAEFAPVAASARATPAAPTTARPTVQFRPPPWYRRYLAVAAGVVAVGLLGVVVVNVGRGGDDDDSGDATAALDEDAAGNDAADAADDGDSSDRGFVESAPTIGSPADAADSGDDGDSGSADSEAELAMDDAAGDEMSDADDMAGSAESDGDDADDSAAADEGSDFEVPPGAVAIVPPATYPAALPDPALLASFGAELVERMATNQLPPSPNTLCIFADPNDPRTVLTSSAFEIETGSIEMLVAIDEATGVVFGIDPSTCRILVEAELP